MRPVRGLYQPAYRAASRSDHPVVEHFLGCKDDLALDFLEVLFHCRAYRGDNDGVTKVNEILREQGVGYELTAFVQRPSDKPAFLFGRKLGAQTIEIEYPRVIEKHSEVLHQAVVRPCLEALAGKPFRIANAELLKAFDNLRHGKFDDAITSCGSAFESVLKTICDQKGWAYDPDKDTCSRLVAICRDHGLFPDFYTPIFEATGTVRNKLGDAHGRGPQPPPRRST